MINVAPTLKRASRQATINDNWKHLSHHSGEGPFRGFRGIFLYSHHEHASATADKYF